MTGKLLLGDAKVETEIANVQALCMVFLRQRRKVPDLEVARAELKGLHCLEFGFFDEQLNLTIVHTVVLVIFEILLLL